jgi:hypothetical protein
LEETAFMLSFVLSGKSKQVLQVLIVEILIVVIPLKYSIFTISFGIMLT